MPEAANGKQLHLTVRLTLRAPTANCGELETEHTHTHRRNQRPRQARRVHKHAYCENEYMTERMWTPPPVRTYIRQPRRLSSRIPPMTSQRNTEHPDMSDNTTSTMVPVDGGNDAGGEEEDEDEEEAEEGAEHNGRSVFQVSSRSSSASGTRGVAPHSSMDSVVLITR
jgi:hypothetical protein